VELSPETAQFRGLFTFGWRELQSETHRDEANFVRNLPAVSGLKILTAVGFAQEKPSSRRWSVQARGSVWLVSRGAVSCSGLPALDDRGDDVRCETGDGERANEVGDAVSLVCFDPKITWVQRDESSPG